MDKIIDINEIQDAKWGEFLDEVIKGKYQIYGDGYCSLPEEMVEYYCNLYKKSATIAQDNLDEEDTI